MKAKYDSSKLVFILLRSILWILLLILVFQGARYAYSYGRAIFMDEAYTEGGVNEDVEVFVMEGSTARKVGEQLEDAGIIEDKTLFYLQAVLSDRSDGIVGGNYVFNSAMKPSRILEMLQTGP